LNEEIKIVKNTADFRLKFDSLFHLHLFHNQWFRMVKKILVIILVLGVVGVCAGVYLWNKPHPKAEDAQAVSIDAKQLAREYSANEKAADTKYLNKVIAVSGTVMEIEKNQDGGLMIILQTDDPAAGIQCAMRDKGLNISKGHITIKGFCSGNGITGVSLTDCVIKK
jgi:hypothetical protein